VQARIVQIERKVVFVIPPWAIKTLQGICQQGLTEEEALRLVFAYGIKALAEAIQEFKRIESNIRG